MSFPAAPESVSEPWWPSSSSLSGPPTTEWLSLSSTFQSTPLTAGQPVCVTLSPPPAVRRLFPGPHWAPGAAGGEIAAAAVVSVAAGAGAAPPQGGTAGGGKQGGK